MWKELIFPSHINLTETEKGLENPIKSGFPVQMSVIRTRLFLTNFVYVLFFVEYVNLLII